MTGRDTFAEEIEEFRLAAETGVCPRCKQKNLTGKLDLIGYTLTCPSCLWWRSLSGEIIR